MDAHSSHSPPGPWLTRAEAAARLRVTPATIDRYARDGVLTRRHLPGDGHARYHIDEVDALLREQGKDKP